MAIRKLTIIALVVLLGLLPAGSGLAATAAATADANYSCDRSSTNTSWTGWTLYSVSKREFYGKDGEVLDTEYDYQLNNTEKVGIYDREVTWDPPPGMVYNTMFTSQVFSLSTRSSSTDTVIVEIHYYDYLGSPSDLLIKDLSPDLGGSERQRLVDDYEEIKKVVDIIEKSETKLTVEIDNDPESYCPLGMKTVRFLIEGLPTGEEEEEEVYAIVPDNQVLFGLEIPSLEDYDNDIDNWILSQDFDGAVRKAFMETVGIELSFSADIDIVLAGSVWELDDMGEFGTGRAYPIRKEGNKVKIYAPRSTFYVSTVTAYECDVDGGHCVKPHMTDTPKQPPDPRNCVAYDTGKIEAYVEQGANLHLVAVPTDYASKTVFLRSYWEVHPPLGFRIDHLEVQDARIKFSDGTSVDLPDHCKKVVPQTELGNWWAELLIKGIFRRYDASGRLEEERTVEERYGDRWEWVVVETPPVPKMAKTVNISRITRLAEIFLDDGSVRTPTFEIGTTPGLYYAVEVATDNRLFNKAEYGALRDNTNFFNSFWGGSSPETAVVPPLQEPASSLVFQYQIPVEVWNNLRENALGLGKIYYRLLVSSDKQSSNLFITVEDDEFQNAPFMSVVRRVINDYNGDGRSDLGFFEPFKPADNAFYVALSTDGSFAPVSDPWVESNTFGHAAGRYYVGDYNGDGKSDLGFFEPSDNSFYVALSTGSGFFAPGSGQWVAPDAFGHGAGRYSVADFNGDGKSDLGFFEPSDNSFYVSLSTGNGFFAPGSGQWVGPNVFGHTAGRYYVGDFNGDRKSDLGFFEPSDSTFHVTLSTGSGFFALGSGQWVTPNAFGHAAGRYYVADFNGDVKSDLGFFEPSDNTFHVTLSTGTGFFASGSGRWLDSDALVHSAGRIYIGDFNGDGRSDLGFFEPADNTFHVTLSTSSSFHAPGSGQWVGPNAFGHYGGRHFVGNSKFDREFGYPIFDEQVSWKDDPRRWGWHPSDPSGPSTFEQFAVTRASDPGNVYLGSYAAKLEIPAGGGRASGAWHAPLPDSTGAEYFIFAYKKTNPASTPLIYFVANGYLHQIWEAGQTQHHQGWEIPFAADMEWHLFALPLDIAHKLPSTIIDPNTGQLEPMVSSEGQLTFFELGMGGVGGDAIYFDHIHFSESPITPVDDPYPPTVTITVPSEDYQNTGYAFTLAGTATDPGSGLASVRVDATGSGGPGSLGTIYVEVDEAGRWSIPLDFSSWPDSAFILYEQVKLEVTATDWVGNSHTATRYVTLPPTVYDENDPATFVNPHGWDCPLAENDLFSGERNSDTSYAGDYSLKVTIPPENAACGHASAWWDGPLPNTTGTSYFTFAYKKTNPNSRMAAYFILPGSIVHEVSEVDPSIGAVRAYQGWDISYYRDTEWHIVAVPYESEQPAPGEDEVVGPIVGQLASFETGIGAGNVGDALYFDLIGFQRTPWVSSPVAFGNWRFVDPGGDPNADVVISDISGDGYGGAIYLNNHGSGTTEAWTTEPRATKGIDPIPITPRTVIQWPQKDNSHSLILELELIRYQEFETIKYAANAPNHWTVPGQYENQFGVRGWVNMEPRPELVFGQEETFVRSLYRDIQDTFGPDEEYDEVVLITLRHFSNADAPEGDQGGYFKDLVIFEDDESPLVSITKPPVNIRWSKDQILTFEGTATDNSAIASVDVYAKGSSSDFTYMGAAQIDTSGNWSIDLDFSGWTRDDLKRGRIVAIKVTATDIAGNAFNVFRIVDFVLTSFTAEAGADHVILTWGTGPEIDNAGFNLHRATAEDGPYTKLNDALILAKGDPESGASYVYTDTAVARGVTYYYELEDVDIHGVSTLHGPVSATLLPPAVWSDVCVAQRMEITGIGMGDRYHTINPQTLALADPASVDWLLAQVAGYGATVPDSVTFTTDAPQSLTLSQPSSNPHGYTFEANLQPTGQISASVSHPGDSYKTPRGLILYSKRATMGKWTSVGKTANSFVYHDSHTELLTFPPLEEATDLFITAVVIDNDDDARPMVLEATAGDVTDSVTELGPTDGDGLNIVNLTLQQVPAETDQASVTLHSPSEDGDSLVLVGLNVSYPCAGAILHVVPSPATIPLGVTGLLTITVTPGPAEVNGVQVHGRLDPTYLHLVDVRPTGVLPVELDPVAFDPATGEFRYGAGLLNGVITEPFGVLVLEVQAMATTTGTLVEFLDEFPPTDISGPEGSVMSQAQDGLVIVTPPPTLRGAVNMQGRPAKPAPPWAIPLSVWLTPASSGTLTHTFAITTDQHGEFELYLEGITPGLYDVRVKGNHTLRNLAPNVSLVSGDNPYFFDTLLEGDAEIVATFNQVLQEDADVLIGSFNQCQGDPGFVANADLDESGCVLLPDFGLLSGNFGKEGDIVISATTNLPSGLLQASSGGALLAFNVEEMAVAVDEVVTLTLEIDPCGQPVNGGMIHLSFDPALWSRW